MIACAAIARDITAFKEAQRATAFLASLVQGSDDAIIGMKPDGTILSWNTGAETIFGYTAEETMGQPISILGPDDRREEQGALGAMVKAGESVSPF